jgi:hypothetical protein
MRTLLEEPTSSTTYQPRLYSHNDRWKWQSTLCYDPNCSYLFTYVSPNVIFISLRMLSCSYEQSHKMEKRLANLTSRTFWIKRRRHNWQRLGTEANDDSNKQRWTVWVIPRQRNWTRNFQRNLILEANILHVYRNGFLNWLYGQQLPVKISRGYSLDSLFSNSYRRFNFSPHSKSSRFTAMTHILTILKNN